MRELDHNGLLLCEYQAKLFEKSLDLECSTPIFMRRFMKSTLVKELDRNESALVSLDVNEGIESIIEEYGESNYGKIKFSNNSMYWIGYMYRYISYTRNERTEFLMKTFDYDLLNKVYYSFHTQDPEWVVQSLLEIKELDPNYLDKNYRLKLKMPEYYKKLFEEIH